MSPEQYGKLSILNTAILILYVFVSLNLQSAVINRIMKKKHDFDVFLSSCIYFLIPFQIFLFISQPLYASVLSRLLGIEKDDVKNVIIICIMLSYIYIYTSYLQGTENGSLYAKINVLNKVCEIALIFVFALALTSSQYLSKIYAQYVICIPLFIYSLFQLKKYIILKFSFRELKDALFFSVPLIIHVLSNALLSQADRIIITDKLGNSSAGVYSFAYNLGMGILVLVMAWNSSWQPKLYRLINDNNSDVIRKVNNASALIVCIVSSIAILFSKEAVVIMSSREYYDGIRLVPLIIIGNALIHVYLTYVNFIFYFKKTVLIALTTLLALGINIIANYILIPLYGILGSAIATVISYLFLCIFHYLTAKFFAKQVNKHNLSIKLLISFFFVLLGMYGAVLISDLIPYAFAILLKIVITICLVGYVIYNRKYKDLMIA